ncbi:MAG: hypothetical protein GTO14_13410 [Anaerolineales bacterium]|nr:hypothetical protein [Anaerolineales bacterium]
MEEDNVEFLFKPRTLTRFFIVIFMVLFVAHIAGWLAISAFDRTFGLYFFDFTRERSVPAFFSSMTMLFCAALLATITAAKRRKGGRGYLYWAGLAIVFVYLSVDEYIGIHEKLSAPVRDALNTSEFLELAWIIPYGIFVAVFVLMYLRFMVGLPRRTRLYFILAGVIYVTGAIVLEIVSGRQEALHGRRSFAYVAAVTVEEGFEIIGIVLFLHALLVYISSEMDGLQISLPSVKA